MAKSELQTEIKSPFSDLKNPTGKHKDWYGPEFVKILCTTINSNEKQFDSIQFVRQYSAKYRNLELKERLNLMVDLLDQHLDTPYKNQLDILNPLLGEPWPYEDGMFTYGFFLYPLSQFVEVHGAKDIKRSLKFIEQLTMRFTGEWAIRPLANIEPKVVLSQMKEWAKHDNFHVRRLASEGLRARLPWGVKISWIDDQPKKSLPIYNKLRNDKVLYVRRSVSNSMGDMIKIDEDTAFETLCGWLEKKLTPENLWVIKHAIRTPVKKKVKRFLELERKTQMALASLKR